MSTMSIFKSLASLIHNNLVQTSIVALLTRRETALICAARTGELDCVRHLLNYGAATEARDGEVSCH